MVEHIHTANIKSKSFIKTQWRKLGAVEIGSQATGKVRLKSKNKGRKMGNGESENLDNEI